MIADTDFAQWIGRSVLAHDELTPAALRRFGAVFDRASADAIAQPLPPLWHWGLFLPDAKQRDIDTDGHPPRGELIPPVPRPRRMWAGGQLRFLAPIRAGVLLSRTSTLESVVSKEGRSGRLTFVRLHHAIQAGSLLAIEERQDIVYRDAAVAGAALPQGTAASRDEDFCVSRRADATLLFRYSALTFNAHRIHYDRDYARDAEGYPGLVVHGPLLATLLVETLQQQRPDAVVEAFEFSAMRPVFDCHAFEICGREEPGGSYSLWIRDHEGFTAMRATASVAIRTPTVSAS